MKLLTTTTAAALTALTLAVPAFAQHHEDRDRAEGTRAVPHERATPRENVAPRVAAPPARTDDRAVPRENVRPVQPQYQPRYDQRSSPRYDSRDVPRYDHDRDYRYEPRYDHDRDYRDYRGYGYYGGPSRYVAPLHFVFRPHFRIGFGFYLGYPIAYPYAYPYYDAYPAGVYYPRIGSGIAYGGIGLQVTPPEAAVYVDGTYVGNAGNFYDPAHPLTLPAGMHHIEVQAPGCAPMVFDADVTPGQVLPYQGQLQPY